MFNFNWHKDFVFVFTFNWYQYTLHWLIFNWYHIWFGPLIDIILF